MDKSYNVSEVATKLNISDKTLRRWEEAGRFRSSRTLGNQRRYSIEDIQILDAIKHGFINSQSDLLTKSQAANLCGVAEFTIDRWEREGKIHPFITVGITYYPKPHLLEKLSELKSSHVEDFAPPREEELSIVPVIEPEPTQEISHRLSSIKEIRELPIKQTPLVSNRPTGDLRTALLNITITILLLAAYHVLFNYHPSKPLSPVSGAVQGAATISDPSLDLLKTILDPSGALTTTAIAARTNLTAPALSLNPTSAPSNPAPGTIYYDAVSQTLKIWKSSAWVDLAPTQTINTKDGTLITASSVLPKGKNSITIQSENITPMTPVTVTFKTDYAPAKKYWLETNQGSFTLHTDFPVSADAPFSYFVLSTNLTAQPTPAPTPIVTNR